MTTHPAAQLLQALIRTASPAPYPEVRPLSPEQATKGLRLFRMRMRQIQRHGCDQIVPTFLKAGLESTLGAALDKGTPRPLTQSDAAALNSRGDGGATVLPVKGKRGRVLLL